MGLVRNWRLIALLAALIFFPAAFHIPGFAPATTTIPIISELFSVSPSNPIPKEDLKKFAERASAKTGIRPALLIAFFTQESSLGKNVGSCFLLPPVGEPDGSGFNFRLNERAIRVMKPDRDIEPFSRILRDLGRNPYRTPVSCWIPAYDKDGNPSGWGGAMGPAQIIPSTWIIVEKRAAMYLGKSSVDPWEPEDAFMAAAVHLKDLLSCVRASGKASSEERQAACMYFSGRQCGSQKSSISRYGDSVMAWALRYEREYYPEIARARAEAAKKAKNQKALAPKKGKKHSVSPKTSPKKNAAKPPVQKGKKKSAHRGK